MPIERKTGKTPGQNNRRREGTHLFSKDHGGLHGGSNKVRGSFLTAKEDTILGKVRNILTPEGMRNNG